MKKLVLLVSFFLLGCDEESLSQSLEEYFESINYVQEQENGSKLVALSESPEILPEWGNDAFQNRCEWFDLERVVDGDTIIVNDGSERIRVRMIGIDTPESKKEGTEIEDYALEASAHLKTLLSDSDQVCLVEDREGDKYDTYGRKLSYVFTKVGADINAEMLESGLAEAYTRFPMERAEAFEALEAQAKQAKVGRWE